MDGGFIVSLRQRHVTAAARSLYVRIGNNLSNLWFHQQQNDAVGGGGYGRK